jgi:hypothetical protein
MEFKKFVKGLGAVASLAVLAGVIGVGLSRKASADLTNPVVSNTDPAGNAQFIWCHNLDAVDHGVGSVVVYSGTSAVLPGVDVSTTTSADSALVAGVVALNTLPASGYGWVQVAGYNSAIKVTVATSAGDILTTSTTAEKVKVNASGTTATSVAMALEATTASTTVKGIILRR